MAELRQESEVPISLFLTLPQYHIAFYQRHLLKTRWCRHRLILICLQILSESLFSPACFRSINTKFIPWRYPLFCFFPLWLKPSSSWFDIIKSIPGSHGGAAQGSFRNEGPHCTSSSILWGEPESPPVMVLRTQAPALGSHSGRF